MVSKVLDNQFACKRITALGGYVTHKKEIYRSIVEKLSANYIWINKDLQEKSMRLIEEIKLMSQDIQETLKMDYLNLVQDIIENHHIDGLILGCTEFSCFRDLKLSMPVIDSNEELAKYVVEYATNIKV